MDRSVESELRDLIFCDPNLVDHFLSGAPHRLNAVLQRCHTNPVYDARLRKWTIPRARSQFGTHRSVLCILNAIKEAVDAVTRQPSVAFVDRRRHAIDSDHDLGCAPQPDFVLFDDTHAHWETVRMTVAVTRLKTRLKDGIRMLARDARAVFAHQLHRRHLYALSVCGSEATFVRFDRAGVLYSEPIDVCGDSDRFTKAFASLLLMDDEAFGFDTMFSTRMNQGRLEYYVDLPQAAFSVSSGPPTRKLKVVECLCHRKTIVSRATIVLRLREVRPLDLGHDTGVRTRGQKRTREQAQPELYNVDYVLKLIWRDPTQESEGEVLEQLIGIYGLAQHMWHCDVSVTCRCAVPTKPCATCVDETFQPAEMRVCRNLTNIDPVEPARSTRTRVPTSETRKHRIYSRILLSSIGKSVWEADNPRELLMGMLDAVMGYWRLVNIGIIHRDISHGNVMLLPPGQRFLRREWKEHPNCPGPLSVSEQRLHEYIERWDRDPTGMLSDFDSYTRVSSASTPAPKSESDSNEDLLVGDNVVATPSADNSRDESGAPPAKRRKTDAGNVPVPTKGKQTANGHKKRQKNPSISERIDYRMGTTTFMSRHVLGVPPGQRYEHTFMDDLESFFWVLFYTVVSHTDPGAVNLTYTTSDVLDRMDCYDLDIVRNVKCNYLKNCVNSIAMKWKLGACRNSWASDTPTVEVILKLGVFFFQASEAPSSELVPEIVFPKIVEILLAALE